MNMTRKQFNKKYFWAYKAMQEGMECKFWNDNKNNYTKGFMCWIDFINTETFGCLEHGRGYKNCELAKIEKCIKEPIEAIRLLIENGYKFIENGSLYKPDNMVISNEMFKYFGYKFEGNEINSFTWPGFLIEERDID